ncbi:hypothetical protein C1N57_18510 [Priestia aryabhattai]
MCILLFVYNEKNICSYLYFIAIHTEREEKSYKKSLCRSIRKGYKEMIAFSLWYLLNRLLI